MLVTLNGVRQLLVVSATRIMGVVPGDGKLLWEYPFATFNGINAAQPLVIGDNRVFVSASYGAGSAMIELSGGGDRFAVREVWRNTRMKNRFSGSVLQDGVIYGLDEGILAAIDAETGELKWKGGRYGYGQVLLAGSNPGETMPPLMQYFAAQKANGGKVVVADPRPSTTAQTGTLHV